MDSWQLEYSRGKRWLARHQPTKALNCFERALLTISTERPRSFSRRRSARHDLSRLFYFFSVALRHAGLRNRAVASLVESTRLVKRGHTRCKLFAVTNAYGMASQSVELADDKHAFYGVQLSRYLESKANHKLGTRAEIDMVADLIDEYWEYVRETFPLSELSVEQKRTLFNEIRLVFPFSQLPPEKGEEVRVDFLHGRRIGAEDTCSCGSGLPVKLCHGRIPGFDELLVGKF
jgi:hypothetical protein